ncbi:MAG: HD domain-containing protein [Spirochaetes bacterium]|jgi:HD-GYP domain-containing protein (c-di-GMP phosphodiesterase class II)|nr:HD domain-containing protein [Spirochaetota bacterium]
MNVSEALKKRGIVVIRSLFDDLQSGKDLDVETSERYIDSLIQEISHQREGMLYLVEPESTKDYLVIHSLNVLLLSLIMGYRIGVEGIELRELGLGAMFHDLGKINTPENLIWKQEGDNEYERTVLSEHPEVITHWLAKKAIIPDEVIHIIKYHHERFDGRGYPEGLTTRDFPRSINIVAICNFYSFQVISIDEKAGEEPRNAFFTISKEGGKRFNPKTVNNFILLMGPMLMDGPIYRRTALVLLDTMEVAAVVKTTGFADTHPEIVVLTNSQGKKLERPVNVDLKKDGSRRIIKLLKA